MHRSNVREFPPRIPRIDSCRKSVHYNTPEQNSTAKHHQFIKKVSVQARFTSISIQLSYKQFTLCCSPTSLIKTSSKTVWIRAHDRSRCMKSSGRFSRVIVWLHPRLCRQTNHITYIIQKKQLHTLSRKQLKNEILPNASFKCKSEHALAIFET